MPNLSEQATVFEIHDQNLFTERSNRSYIFFKTVLRLLQRIVESPTSSRGSSVSWGRELDSRPTMKGVGVQTMSSMAGGSTGM